MHVSVVLLYLNKIVYGEASHYTGCLSTCKPLTHLPQ
jgi:hypothetical protein